MSGAPCLLHTPPLLIQTNAPSSAPMSAVLPSAERDTDRPWSSGVGVPDATNLVPCWVHIPPLLVQTQAAPGVELSKRLPSLYPPTIAVFPSAERATAFPWKAFPTAPEPT